MSDWVHIEPPAPRLTPVQERIREMMRNGKTFREICAALMIRTDHLRDEIFEIRKYEVLMGEKKRLTDEQKAAIIEMRQAGKPYKEISETVGCAKQTAVNVWNAFLHSDKPAKKTAINKEFDDAVNEMIAEMHAETEPATVQIPAAVPDAVMDAVRDKIDELQKQVDERAAEIALLNEKISSLNAWLSEVQA